MDHLLIGGGTAALSNLAELTESHIGVPTTIANPFLDMATSNKINKANLMSDAPSFLIATGLAIRGTEHL